MASTSTSTPPEKVRNPGGCMSSNVWNHFEKTPLKSAGHYAAKCKFCSRNWPRGSPKELEEHLANECSDVSEIIRSFYLGVVSSRDFGEVDFTSSKSNKKRKNQNQDQRDLTDWFEPTTISTQKVASINRALLRAFVCCGIPFSVIENPFFVEFLYEMRPGYDPPTREMLSGRLLSQETSRVNVKIDEIIKDSKHLTLGKFLSIKLKFLFYFNYISLKFFFFLKHLMDGLIQLIPQYIII